MCLCFLPFFPLHHCFHRKYWISLMNRSNSKDALFFFKGLPLNLEGVVFHGIPFLNSQILVLIIGSKYESLSLCFPSHLCLIRTSLG